MISLECHPDGILLRVRASAGAKRSGITGEHGGALCVSVHEAAERGKANQAIIKLLSQSFDLPKSAILLVRGATARQKQFLLQGLSFETANQAVIRLLQHSGD